MKTITVRVNGDTWINQAQVRQQLANTKSTDLICFDTGAEGISLDHSGILSYIDQWVSNSHHPADRVVINSPNVYEKTSYQNINCADNHFLHMSGHYYTDVPPINVDATKFGFFVGRHTPERDAMAVDIVTNYAAHTVISIMKTAYAVSPWSKVLQCIGSIDNMEVRNQYQDLWDTNLSILKFYNQFQIEIVAETMCAGTTFFPTEKTFRPITGRRPFIVYGPKKFLNNLQNLGFRTYNECWDERYDQYQGMNRWHSIRQVISNIIRTGYNVELAREIAQHNRTHLTQWHKFTKPKQMRRAVV